MPNKRIIRNSKEFPDTHNFVYKTKRYPFKIIFFNFSSKYFMKNADELRNTEDIDLIDEDIGNQLKLQEDTIFYFINYVQQKEIPLDIENVVSLHYLSVKFEIEDLEEETKDFISANHKELAIKILSNCQFDTSFNDSIYEDIISHNLLDYINDEELVTLPISKIYSILTKYSQERTNQINSREMNDFILKCIEKYGRDSSILLSFAQIDKENIEFIDTIFKNYSKKIDFDFINSSAVLTLLEVYYEQKNIVMAQEKKNEELLELNKKLSFEKSDLENQKNLEILSLEKKLNSQIEALDAITIEKNDKISSLEAELEEARREKDEVISSYSESFFTCDMSLKEPGILAHLKELQKTPFDRLFVASLSSDDIYTLLVSDSDDYFGTSKKGNFFIEFEFETAVLINGIRIFSSTFHFPKSFDISVENEIVKSVKNSNELNGQNKSMTIIFEPIQGRKVRFIQTGQGWDKSNTIWIKGIELLSPDEKYSRGVFETLLVESEKHDPHKLPVLISASSFDLNTFHIIDAKHKIYTHKIHGFRLS